MKKTLLKTFIFLISLSGFSQSFTELVSYNSATSNAFDGISGNCNVGIKISTTQNGIYIDYHLQSFDLKTLRIANKDIPASQVPSYAILDKRIDVTFDLYVNNVFVDHYGQPSVSWARLQGLSNSDSYKPATSENGYKLFNSGAISVKNVKVTKLNYRVKEDYYMQIRNEIAGKTNKITTENPVKQGNSTSLTIENNSSNNNPVTKTSTTSSGVPVNTSGNDPLAHFETDGKTYTNPMSNNTNSGSSSVDNFNKGYTQGQQIVNAATALYTNPITNTSSGSSAVDSFTKGYAQGEQIVEVATALIDLFTPSPEQIRKREEERQRIQAEATKKEAVEKAMWDNFTDAKYLEKAIADANNGDENARMFLIYEIHTKSYAKDMTHLLPNIKNWIDEAVKNKNLDAMNFIGHYSILEIKNNFDNLKYTKDEGLKILEEAVTLNSADAMFSLGEYYNKKRAGNNPEKAFYFYLKAAEHNLPVAMYALGQIYLNKCTFDYSAFVKYKIEKNGNLGCTYIHNSLLCKDSQETLYQKYAIYGNKFMKFKVYKELASMYENGTGCPKDKEMAKTLYDESAKSLYDFSMKTVR
jgi:TPR repeat protein